MQKKEKEQKLALELRQQGMSLLNIAKELNVSKGSVSAWVRSIPIPEKFTKSYRATKKAHRKKVINKIRQEKSNRKKYLKEHVYEHLEHVSKTGLPLFNDIRLLSGDERWMIPVPFNYKGKAYIKNLYVYEHRLIMEQYLNRLLTDNEVVHHINEDKLDNRLANLTLTSTEEHIKKHIHKEAVLIPLICDFCNNTFERLKRKHNKNNKHKFCCLSHAVRFQQKERRKRLRSNI